MKFSRAAICKLLDDHYSAPLQTVFKQFRLGGSLFFVGLLAIYFAHQTLEPSLRQEWIMLCGVVLVAIGFVIAMLAQIRMLIIRLLAFFRDRDI